MQNEMMNTLPRSLTARHPFTRRIFLPCLFLFSICFAQYDLGDLNQDESMDVLDIVRLVHIILEEDLPPSPYELYAGNVNIDHTSDVIDIILILNTILEIDDCHEEKSPCNYNFSECCFFPNSGDFFWEADTFGRLSNSIRDVWVFDENNIWAVGFITPPDSVGTYGFVIWDGYNWNITQLFYSFWDYLFPLSPRGIWAFAPDDIWLADGSIFHYDGGEYATIEWVRDWDTDESVDKIWAASPTDIYFVGWYGTIIHYDGEEFTEIESNTDCDLYDIYGVLDEQTGEKKIWVVGHTSNEGESIVLYSEGEEWEAIYNYYGWDEEYDDSWFQEIIRTVWVYDPFVFFAGSNGAYKHIIGTDIYLHTPWEDFDFGGSFPFKLRGNNPNDLILTGEYLINWHFNGVHWTSIGNENYHFGHLKGLVMYNNSVIAGGSTIGFDPYYGVFTSRALIKKGIRE